MKKSTWFYMLSVLCIVGGQLAMAFYTPLGLSAGVLLIVAGFKVGKLGTRHYNIEHGRDADYIMPRNNLQNKRIYAFSASMAVVAIALIIYNAYVVH